jgi:hypothetical protein
VHYRAGQESIHYVLKDPKSCEKGPFLQERRLPGHEREIFLDADKANLVKMNRMMVEVSGLSEAVCTRACRIPSAKPQTAHGCPGRMLCKQGSRRTGNFSSAVNRDKVTEMGQISKINCQFSSSREIAFGGHKKILDTCRRRML